MDIIQCLCIHDLSLLFKFRRCNKKINKNKLLYNAVINHHKRVDNGVYTYTYLGKHLHSFNDKPAIIWIYGTVIWCKHDKIHRDGDKPAIIKSNGLKYWYKNGKLHREDGPAVEESDGSKYWSLNGKLHREDGPAVERSNGDKSWWLNGQRLTEDEFNERMAPTVEMTMAQISEALGKKVKVVK